MTLQSALKETLIRLGRQIGRRGSFLLYLAFLNFVYAFSLAFPTERSLSNPTSVFLASIMPLWLWATLWGGVGLVCLFFAFRIKDAIGYAAAMFLMVLWALVFLLGWLFADVERGYLSAAIWGAFVVLLALVAGWQENRPLTQAPDEVA